ncbi:hypothetical protein ZTR_09511 [Talaromyces verruculosus]|nr:hypothetical protein ZTR_09511 [Talaromyces verruculosus]
MTGFGFIQSERIAQIKLPLSNSTTMTVPTSDHESNHLEFYTIPSYSQVACVGTGLSAIALGATLKRWYNLEDIRFFDRQSDCGGTWYINSYPGCACDVPSALYSFSFAMNPSWTKVYPEHAEIKQYEDDVVKQYGLREKMSFRTEVKKCIWRDDANRWLLFLLDLETGKSSTHECQILFAATGQLIEPRPCDIPGASSFEGALFHSARWNHSVSLRGKNVVVVGNGSHNFTYHKFLTWIFRYVPFTMKLHRFHIFLLAEKEFRLFLMTKAAALLRKKTQQAAEKYMRDTAPAKYHQILIPDFDIGCKRRIYDSGYLKSLNSKNLQLRSTGITEIVPNGVRTPEGIIPADVIVLATGFKTNSFIPYMTVHGINGTIQDHWKRYDGPEAYNCSAMSGFPNFFMILGPNSVTGHTSALMAAENSVNYALRILKPVLMGNAASVDIKQKAEDDYVYKLRGALQERVWNADCASWYLNEKKWNAMSYPWTQFHYWYRSTFPVWSDWNFKVR